AGLQRRVDEKAGRQRCNNVDQAHIRTTVSRRWIFYQIKAQTNERGGVAAATSHKRSGSATQS
ncbi:hypothetical protein, partial [Geothermobacter hydrogeniphilus]|uniref:hypothetical protein n=1 Tax=Geothermobacter hydrogeniphilus TaxID=1969733 RepID=UPI001C0D7761